MQEEVKFSVSVHARKMMGRICAYIILGIIGILIGVRILNKNDNLLVGSGVCVLGIFLFFLGVYFFFTTTKQFELTTVAGGKLKARIFSGRRQLVVDPIARIAFFYREPSYRASLTFVKIYAVFYHQPVFAIYNAVPGIFAMTPRDGFTWYRPGDGDEADLFYKVKMFDGPVERVFELYHEYK